MSAQHRVHEHRPLGLLVLAAYTACDGHMLHRFLHVRLARNMVFAPFGLSFWRGAMSAQHRVHEHKPLGLLVLAAYAACDGHMLHRFYMYVWPGTWFLQPFCLFVLLHTR